MQFLVISRPASPAPPEMVVPLVRALRAWADEHRASGRMRHVWAFAGTGGGVAVLDVESHEELDAIMSGDPFQDYSVVEVVPLCDFDASIDGGLPVYERMRATLGPSL